GARELARADLFVDAMFGTGFRGALEGDAAWLAEQARHVPRVLAVDIPSGVDGSTGGVHGTAVRADATVTFAYLKPGLLFEPGRTLAGTVEVADIGIHADGDDAVATVTSASDVRAALGARAADEHKWRAAVLVVGGSSGM